VKKPAEDNTTFAFDTFIAIDWSGAAGRYDGIAVAKCNAGRSAPCLVNPIAPRWTRSEIVNWICSQLDGNQRLLIGLDFAFGFPFEGKDVGYLGGCARQGDSIFSLWKLIEEKCCADPDFGCTTFIRDPGYESLFWKSGPLPEAWVERKRRTELACVETTQTRPETVYKLIGSKQVGKGSVTGIRVLNHIRSSRKECVSFWPFDEVRGSTIVEIYPTLFRKSGTGSLAKLRSHDLKTALGVFGSDSMHRSRSGDLSDHETDALISAAGLRSLARIPATWSHPELGSPRVQREGWIFGVGGGSCPHAENRGTAT
jgi:hypothetical protein